VEQLNADSWILPAQNATIDLRTGTAREHRREDLCTGYVDVRWDPAAECPLWKQFLLDVMAGNAELVEFLQRAIGYTLTGDTREQVLFFLIGAGSNGKSTFVRVLQRLLGYLACQAAPGLLLLKRNDAHPTELADLFGKRLVVATEIGEGRSFAEETIKQLTGEDKIRARKMRDVAGGQPEIHFQRRSGDPVIHPDIGTTAGNSAGAAEAG
jgi:putative DNA primase/helicase